MTSEKFAKKFLIPTEEDTFAIATVLAKLATSPLIIFLEGELGAGKTTFTRGFLRGLNYQGKVKSPTYTLVETYPFNSFTVYHYDFYRINDPQELLNMGIQDYFTHAAIHLIEWPQLLRQQLPCPDLTCKIEFAKQERILYLQANSAIGKKVFASVEWD